MYEQTQDLEATGLTALVAQLSELIEQASFYKLQKSQRNVKHFIEQRMLGDLKRLCNKAKPRLERHWQQQQQDIQAHVQHVSLLITDEIEQRISRLVQQYQQEANRDRVVEEVQQYLNQILNQQIPQQLKRFIQDVPQQSIDLSPDTFPHYVEQYIEVPQYYGQAQVVLFSALFALISGIATFAVISGLTTFSGVTSTEIFTQINKYQIFKGINTDQILQILLSGGVSALTHWWTAKQLKLGRLRVKMIKEKVNAQGQDLT